MVLAGIPLPEGIIFPEPKQGAQIFGKYFLILKESAYLCGPVIKQIHQYSDGEVAQMVRA